jgi:hypothetical protein
MQDLMILHAKNIYTQSNRDDFKAYIHIHGTDMQIHSAPKSLKQKAHEMELSELHHEEFSIFALEYNTSSKFIEAQTPEIEGSIYHLEQDI